MKRTCMAMACMLCLLKVSGQKKWDGEGADGQWLTAANWQPDGVPEKGASVRLDNSLVQGSYSVLLPTGNLSVSLASLQIAPSEGSRILLHLPVGNTAAPGLQITGSGESLVLEEGAELRNASGAGSGDPLSLTGLMRICNGARYVHSTPRSNARLIDRLSTSAGTEKGIFEFDVPGTPGYIISLSGNTFGTLVLAASAAGGVKSYSGSGASELRINGGLIVRSGASFNCTMTGDIQLKGDLEVQGNLQLNPSTAGTSGRSLLFSGSQTTSLKGSGTLTLQKNFRNLEVRPGTELLLERDVLMQFPGNTFSISGNAGLRTGISTIRGEGTFQLMAGGWIEIGSPAGISAGQPSGNIQTRVRNFHKAAGYRYAGQGPQVAGDGLPDTVRILGVDKPGGDLELTADVLVTEQLELASGHIRTGMKNLLAFSGNTITSPASNYGEADAGWENSFVHGPFRRISSSSAPLVFPVGKDGVFAPVKLIPAGIGPADWRVEYFHLPYADLQPVADPPICNISTAEYWEMASPTGQLVGAVTPVLSWRSLLEPDAREAWKKRVRVAQYENRGTRLQWEELGEAPIVTGTGNAGYVNSNQATTRLSVITLAEKSPNRVLPLTPFSLSSVVRDNGVALSWRWPGDEAVLVFEVEKSGGTEDFSRISSLPGRPLGQGTSYFHTDGDPRPGRNMYRIKAVTVTGTVRYSDITVLSWVPRGDARIYPDPVSDRFCLVLPAKSSGFVCSIVNMNGEVVARPFIAPLQVQMVDVRDLRSGKYLLQLKSRDRTLVIPFIRL